MALNGARIPEFLKLRCAGIIATGRLERSGGEPGGPPRQSTELSGQQALKASRGDEKTGAPELGIVQAFDDELRPTGEEGYRVELERIEN